MPYSSTEGKEQLREWFERVNPKTVLDVGPGSGTYYDLLGHRQVHWTGVEIWEPYVEQFHLRERYDEVIIVDIRDFPWGRRYFDVIILGDVLEHMSREEALALWAKARSHCTGIVLLSIPIIDYPQGEYEGNPHEAHLATWTHDGCLALPGVYDSMACPTVGVYVATGDA
jgi:2-polyprenyl-3-methyl-5-hydroxy-6-metoxy-1,4-benzoquinol methylase